MGGRWTEKQQIEKNEREEGRNQKAERNETDNALLKISSGKERLRSLTMNQF